MPSLFVDAGGFYALADTGDRHHEQASAVFLARAGDLVTSDYVVVETWFLIRRHLGYPAAMRFWDALRRRAVTLLGVAADDMNVARKIATDWPDQRFSLVDCTSFALLERLGIRDVLAFDRHFRVYRYGPRRSKAFTVLP